MAAWSPSRHYNELFTMHGSTMVYLVIVPVALAAGLYFVPLQVGAAEIAGPRVALAGLWLYVLGGAWHVVGLRSRAAAPASASWWGFDPLSESIHSPGSGMDLWIFGVMLATLGQILWAGLHPDHRTAPPRAGDDADADAACSPGRWWRHAR